MYFVSYFCIDHASPTVLPLLVSRDVYFSWFILSACDVYQVFNVCYFCVDHASPTVLLSLVLRDVYSICL